MRRETNSQLVDVAIERIYDAALDPDRMPEAIGAVVKTTGAIGGMLGIFDVCRGDGHAPWIHGLDPQLLQLFEQRFTLNPWTELVRRQAVVGQAMSSEPFVDAMTLRRTAFHDAILRPQGIVGQSFCLLRRDGRFTIGLAMMYGAPGRSARPEVLYVHQQLGRHVTRAFELGCRLGTLRKQLDTAEAALERQACAVFALDGRATIHYANARARRLLSEGDGLLSLGRRLIAPSGAHSARLATMVAAASAPATGASRRAASLVLPRGVDRLPLLATLVRATELRRLPMLPVEGSNAGVLMFVADPSERGGSVAADLLHEAFGLTDREISVALATVRLGSLPAAAAELRIAPTTARSHLQHVFDKTGTRHQVALAQLLDVCGVLPHGEVGG